MLKLVAVNVASWDKGKREDLIQLLSLFRYGPYPSLEDTRFAGVDTESKLFVDLNKSIAATCTKLKSIDYRKQGEIEVADISEREMEALQ